MSRLYDLASLTKTLVTAPLALKHLEFSRDYSSELGLEGSYTLRELLSHTAGLPPWLPFSPGLRVSDQLRQLASIDVGSNALLKFGSRGVVSYSDVSFRLVCELLELKTGKKIFENAINEYGADSVLHHPWVVTDEDDLPVVLPDGPDKETWDIASSDPYPSRGRHLPHDANARAGMRGHAGFAVTVRGFENTLRQWASGGWPQLQAVDVAANSEGLIYGFGLHHAQPRYAHLLSKIGSDVDGVVVLEQRPEHEQGELAERTARLNAASTSTLTHTQAPDASGWWMHTGFAGCVVLVRPFPREKCLVIGILATRLGPGGELLDKDELVDRRLAILADWCGAQTQTS